MKPSEWTKLLAPEIDWRTCYPQVTKEVRAWLAKNKDYGQHTTQELVEGMFPEDLAKGPAGLAARVRLFRAVQAMAFNDLRDCAAKGPPRMLRHTNKQVRPWIWSHPAPKECCPLCGQAIPPEPPVMASANATTRRVRSA